MVRKISVSPTVTSPLTFGIEMLKREARAAVAITRNTKPQSSWRIATRCSEKTNAAAPTATTKYQKGLKERCLFTALGPDLAPAAGDKVCRSIHETRTLLFGNKLVLPGLSD